MEKPSSVTEQVIDTELEEVKPVDDVEDEKAPSETVETVPAENEAEEKPSAVTEQVIDTEFDVARAVDIGEEAAPSEPTAAVVKDSVFSTTEQNVEIKPEEPKSTDVQETEYDATTQHVDHNASDAQPLDLTNLVENIHLASTESLNVVPDSIKPTSVHDVLSDDLQSLHVVQPLEDVTVTPGCDVTLTVIVSGYPQPTVFLLLSSSSCSVNPNHSFGLLCKLILPLFTSLSCI